MRNGYNILRPIVEARGYDVSMATRLCELPCVYCDMGYRRRARIYARRLLDADWVGKEYQLIMEVKDQAKPAIFDPAMVEVHRVNLLWMIMNAGGPIPPGIQNLTTLKLFKMAGNGTHGAENALTTVSNLTSVTRGMSVIVLLGGYRIAPVMKAVTLGVVLGALDLHQTQMTDDIVGMHARKTLQALDQPASLLMESAAGQEEPLSPAWAPLPGPSRAARLVL